MKLKLKSPLTFWSVNQPFGANFNNFYKESGMLGHNGIDFFALDSTPVYATHDGRITFTGYDGGGGLGVVIRTEEKFDYYNPKTGELEPVYFKTIYWHLKKDTIKVSGGQQVKAGDLIALADNTGRSTGAHLHFGLKPMYRDTEKDWLWYNLDQNNGYMGAIDPQPYFENIPDVKQPTNNKPAIKELQILLNKYGAKLVVDGIYGKLSSKAFEDFIKQRSH